MLSVWPVALLGIRLIGLEHDCPADAIDSEFR